MPSPVSVVQRPQGTASLAYICWAQRLRELQHCCRAAAQLFVYPRRCFSQCISFKIEAKIELADGNAGFASPRCHPEARWLQGEILPRAKRELIPLLHGDLGGSFSPASVFTFHRFYGSGRALQQVGFCPGNSQQVQERGGCSQGKARLRGKNRSTSACPAISNWGQGNPTNYCIH